MANSEGRKQRKEVAKNVKKEIALINHEIGNLTERIKDVDEKKLAKFPTWELRYTRQELEGLKRTIQRINRELQKAEEKTETIK